MQGLNWCKVQLVQGFSWLNGSFVSRVFLSKILVFNWSMGSSGSGVQLIQGFNWFKGLIGSRVQFRQGFNWLKG